MNFRPLPPEAVRYLRKSDRLRLSATDPIADTPTVNGVCEMCYDLTFGIDHLLLRLSTWDTGRARAG